MLPPSGNTHKLPGVNEQGKEHNHVNNHVYLRFVLQLFEDIHILFHNDNSTFSFREVFEDIFTDL